MFQKAYITPTLTLASTLTLITNPDPNLKAVAGGLEPGAMLTYKQIKGRAVPVLAVTLAPAATPALAVLF